MTFQAIRFHFAGRHSLVPQLSAPCLGRKRIQKFKGKS